MSDNLTKRNTVGIGGGLHARLAKQSTSPLVDVSTFPHRIALMLDVSGSMATDGKIESLRDAMTGFLNSCDLSTTGLAIETFGDDHPHVMPLSSFHPLLMTSIMALRASGGTPMHIALEYVLHTYSLTRGVLVSDGEPDRPSECEQLANEYRDAGVPVDCVHIGNSSHGERLMRQLAEITGGLYVKFTDVSQFANNFKYLTPALRAFLTDGSGSASLLGATEIKQ